MSPDGVFWVLGGVFIVECKLKSASVMKNMEFDGFSMILLVLLIAMRILRHIRGRSCVSRWRETRLELHPVQRSPKPRKKGQSKGRPKALTLIRGRSWLSPGIDFLELFDFSEMGGGGGIFGF